MAEMTDFSIKVTFQQPQLQLERECLFSPTSTAVITFGRWFKGDKGDKGDKGESWNDDFDLATNEDIDSLF